MVVFAQGTVKRTSSLGAPTIQLSGHEGAVYSVAFDKDGQNLASASFDRRICKSLLLCPMSIA